MSTPKVGSDFSLQASPEELLEQYLGGDEESFSLLAKHFEKALYGMTSSLSVPEEEKEDLRQEGLIGLFKAVHLFDPALSSFSTFARICMRSAVSDGLRRYKRRREDAVEALLEEEIPSSPEENPERLLLEKCRLQEMLQKMDGKLSPLERRVFALHLGGKSADEIALLIQKERKSVENTLFRARKKLSSLFSFR